MSKFPECPSCNFEHQDTDWLLSSGCFDSEDHSNEAICLKCKQPFYVKTNWNPNWETALDEDDL